MKEIDRFFEAGGNWIIGLFFPDPKYIIILFRDRFLFQHYIECLAKDEYEILNLLQGESYTVIAIMRPKP